MTKPQPKPTKRGRPSRSKLQELEPIGWEPPSTAAADNARFAQAMYRAIATGAERVPVTAVSTKAGTKRPITGYQRAD